MQCAGLSRSVVGATRSHHLRTAPRIGCSHRALTTPSHSWATRQPVWGSTSRGHLPRQLSLSPQASKGFGSGNTTRKRTDDEPSQAKGRRMKRKSTQPPPMPVQQQPTFQVEAQQAVAPDPDAVEFAERLKALKAQGEELKSARAASPGPGAGPLSPSAPTAGPGSAAGPAAFDQPVSSIYDNPPSLQDTLMSSLNSDISDPKLKAAQFGPSQIGIAVSAIIFGLVFVLVAGGDFAPYNRFKGVRSTQEMPDTVEQGIINTRIGELKDQLTVDKNNVDMLQALAYSYAQLLEYDKAADYMDKVVARQPNNADAWRLLGETSLLAEQAQRSVKAYEKATSLRDNDLQIATGMVDSYIATGQYAKAVTYLEELRARAPTVSALGVVARDAAPAAAEGAAPADAAPAAAADAPDDAAGTTDAAPAGKRALRPLEPVGVELLLAKTYSAWRGHDNDALATYDNLIARFPEDFRGYLAKGVFLRDKGRRADAERMFLQAKFYAPENRQRFVKEQAETRPVVDLPDQ